VEELYEGKAKPKAEDVCLLEDNVQTDLQGPSLHLSEFEAALKELKNGKTRDRAELLKALGSRGKQELFQICCEIYDSGE